MLVMMNHQDDLIEIVGVGVDVNSTDCWVESSIHICSDIDTIGDRQAGWNGRGIHWKLKNLIIII